MYWILTLTIATFWGGSFIAIKEVVQIIDPRLGVFLRILIALVSIRVMQFVLKKEVRIKRQDILIVSLAGLFSLAFPFMFLFWGETRISAGLSGIINSTVPFWTFILSVNFLAEEKFTSAKASGIFFGIIGIVFIFYPQISFKSDGFEMLGMLAVLGMAICYAIGNVLTRVVLRRKGASFHGNLFYQHLASAIVMALVCLIFCSKPVASDILNTKVVVSILYLGIFSTALALFIFYYLIGKFGAVKASVVIYIVPIMALFWDYVFFRNIPEISQIIGMCIIFGGVLLTQKKSKNN